MKIVYLGTTTEPTCGTPVPRLRLSTDSAMVRPGQPLFLPDFIGAWEGELVPAVRIGRLGLGVDERFASRYYDAFTLVHHLLPAGAPAGEERFGLPDVYWCHDGAFACGEWRGMPAGPTVEVSIDGGAPAEMRVDAFDKAVAAVSRYMTIKTGDIIALAGEAAATGPLRTGTTLTAADAAGPYMALKIR